MTGRMPSAHGVIFNDRSLDWSANTFVRRFRHSGYRTALIGKSHLQHGMSKNSMVPFRGEGSGQLPFPEGWDQIEDFERYLDGAYTDPDDFYGFDHLNLSIDHGARVAGHHLEWARQRGGKDEELLIDQDTDAPGSQRSKHWRQIYKPPYGEELHSTTFVTEKTIEFIDSAHAQKSPWLAWCSFPDPHHPMTPPGQWFDRYNPNDMQLPESRFDKLSDAPEHLRFFAGIHPKNQRNWVAPCVISMIDDGVGRILQHLETLGVRDNTIIIFTSDHGDMMGDHSLFLKGFMHYRGTLQVPLVIDVPRSPTGRTNSLASSIDLGPTLMELCGVRAYDGIQGQSLAPVLNDAAASVRESVLIEDDVSMTTASLTPIPARTRTLMMDNLRYTRNSKGEEQLFNLADDPDEMHDQKTNSPARNRMLEGLTHAMMLADDSSRGAPSTH